MRTMFSVFSHRRVLGTLLLTIGVIAAVMLGFGIESHAQTIVPNVPTGEGLVTEPNRGELNLPISEDLRLDQAIKNIINFFLGFLAFIAVLIIIIAGIRLVVSAGNEDAQKFAKQAITWSIIGLLLIALSWSIVSFVIDVISAGGGTQSGGGRGANTMNVQVYTPDGTNTASISSSSIVSTGTPIDVNFSAGNQSAWVRIDPIFDPSILGDMTRYTWEVTRFDVASGYQAGARTEIGNIENVTGKVQLNAAVGKLSFEGGTETMHEGTCATNCSLNDQKPTLLVKNYPQGYVLSLRFVAYNRQGQRLGSNDFTVRTSGSSTGGTSGTSPAVVDSTDPSLTNVAVNGNARREDTVDGKRVYVVAISGAAGTDLNLRLGHSKAVVSGGITFSDTKGNATFTNISRSVDANKNCMDVECRIGSIGSAPSAAWMTVLTNYDDKTTKEERILLLVNHTNVASSVAEIVQGTGREFTEILFGIDNTEYLSGGVYSIDAPKALQITSLLNTSLSGQDAKLFTHYRAVLNGFQLIGSGELQDGKKATITIPQDRLLSGQVYTLQIAFLNRDMTVQRTGSLRIAVAANVDPQAPVVTSDTPLLQPRIKYTFNSKNYIHDLLQKVPVVLPAQATSSDAGILLSVKTGTAFHVAGLKDPVAITNVSIRDCRWDIGQGRVFTQAECADQKLILGAEETIRGTFSYQAGTERKELPFILDIRQWGPYFTITPPAAQLDTSVTFTPEEELIDDRDLPLVRSILSLPAGSPLNRLQIRWKFFKTLEEAMNLESTPMLTLEGDTLRHAFTASEGFVPGSDYFARMEVTYTFFADGQNKQQMFFSTNTFSILNRAPVAMFTAKQDDPEKGNVYTLDGTGSYDPDGEITAFTWSIKQTLNKDGQVVNQAYQTIAESSNRAQIPLTLHEAGEYAVRLEVKDAAGLQAIREQKITQRAVLNMDFFAGSTQSTMSPDKMIVISRTGNQPAQLLFGLNNVSNDIQYYEWNFGDGTTERTLGDIRERAHTYTSAGTYRVQVTGYDNKDNRTLRTKEVYIAEAEQPRAIIDVNFVGGPIFPIAAGQSACKDASGKGVNTYQVTRGTQIRFDGSKSINQSGQQNGLEYRWNVAGMLERYTPTFTQQFTNLPRTSSCLPVTLRVTEAGTNKTHTSEPVYFQIVNAPPTLGAVRVSSSSVRTPAEVRVRAENVRDEDGTVVKYTWYYYEAGNNPEAPGAKQGIQETTTPHAVFLIPSNGTAGSISQYVFGVDITDNEGNTTSSYKIVGEEGAMMTITNAAPPVLGLNLIATPAQINVGSSVTFRAVAQYDDTPSAVSGGFYSYDIDGDGTYDFLNQGPTFTYRYTGQEKLFENITETTTIPITARAQVFVRNQVAEAQTPVRVVKTITKPQADFTYRIVGDRVYFTSTSKGSRLIYEWDLDARAEASCQNPSRLTFDANIANPSKIYSAVGDPTYKVILRITDENKLTDCVEKSVQMLRNAAPPAVQLQVDVFGRFVRFRNLGDTNRTLAYQWYFNSSERNVCANTASLLTTKTPDSIETAPTHTYPTPGTYHVAVVASDTYGATSCAERTLDIKEAQTTEATTTGLRGVSLAPLQIQVGKSTVMTGEKVFVRGTIMSRTGSAIAEPIYGFDIDANVNPGRDLNNVNRTTEISYAYDTYAAHFTPNAQGVLQAVFEVKGYADYEGSTMESDPVRITVLHDPIRSAQGTVAVSADKQQVSVGEPVTFQMNVPAGVDEKNVRISVDVNDDGIFDVTVPGNKITYQFTGKEFPGTQETQSTRVRAKLVIDNKEIQATPIPVQVRKGTGGTPAAFGAELILPSTRVQTGNAQVYHARVIQSDGSVYTGRTFSYDFDGDGVYEFVDKGDRVQYAYAYEQFKTKFQRRGGALEATFQPRVKVRIGTQELISPVSPITVVAPQATTLTPQVRYISPNPGPYVENALVNKEILVPLEAAASEEGITLDFAEMGTRGWNTTFRNQVTWKIGEQTLARPLDQPVTLQLPQSGTYPSSVTYTLQSGEQITEEFTLVVLPWSPKATITPNIPTADGLVQLVPQASIVEFHWDVLRQHRHVIPSMPIQVMKQGWTIRAKDSGTVVYTTTDREIHGVLSELFSPGIVQPNTTFVATYEYVLQMTGEQEPLSYTDTIEFTVTGSSMTPTLVWYQRDTSAPERFWLDGTQTMHAGEGTTYTWTVVHEDVEIDHMTNKDGVYIWSAPRQGLYDITLQVTDAAGTTGSVTKPLLVTEVSELRGVSTTSTQTSADFDAVALVGGRVVFRSNAGKDALTTFWDLDTGTDKDGDGKADNDIESEEAIFEANYARAGTYPVQLTVTDMQGLTYTRSKLITSKGGSRADLRTQTLQANLQTLPLANEQGVVVLREDNPVIVFIPSDSTGAITSYGIDVNTSVDTNGDGTPDNDMDNASHPSATTGDPFSYTYNPASGPVTALLVVTDEQGNKARAEVRIMFTSGDTITTTQYGQEQYVNRIEAVSPEERRQKSDTFLAALEQVNISELRKNYFKERVAQMNDPALSPYDREVLRRELAREVDELLITNREKAVLRALLDEIPVTEERQSSVPAELLTLDEIIEQIQARIRTVAPRQRLEMNKRLLKIKETYGVDPMTVDVEVTALRTEVQNSTLPANLQTEVNGFLDLITDKKVEEDPTTPTVPDETIPTPIDPVTPGEPTTPTEEPTQEQPARSGLGIGAVVWGILRFALIILGILFGIGVLLFLSYLFYKAKSGKEDLEFEDYVLHLRTYVTDMFSSSTSKEPKQAPQAQVQEEVVDVDTSAGGELPSWLQLDQQEETSSQKEETTLPPWMTMDDQTTAVHQAEDTVIPSWLQDVPMDTSTEEPTTTSTSETTTAPWLQETPSTPKEDGLPSWLTMDADDTTAEVQEEPVVQLQEEIPQSSAQEMEPETPKESTIELPDWLKEEDEQENTTIQETEEMVPETVSVVENTDVPEMPEQTAQDETEQPQETEQEIPYVQQPQDIQSVSETPMEQVERPKKRKYTTPADVFLESTVPVQFSEFIGFDESAEPTPPPAPKEIKRKPKKPYRPKRKEQ